MKLWMLVLMLMVVGCSERKIYKEFPDFGVTLETDSKTVNKYSSSVNMFTRIDEKTSRYMTSDLPAIKKLSNDLRIKAKEKQKDEVDYTIRFVQALSYRSDATLEYDTKDYIKYPVETLMDGNGDCEDLSFLLYSLLEADGYDVAIILFSDHMMVGIACEGNCGYQYTSGYSPIESTAKNPLIGYLPEKYRNRENIEIFKNPNAKNYQKIRR